MLQVCIRLSVVFSSESKTHVFGCEAQIFATLKVGYPQLCLRMWANLPIPTFRVTATSRVGCSILAVGLQYQHAEHNITQRERAITTAAVQCEKVAC